MVFLWFSRPGLPAIFLDLGPSADRDYCWSQWDSVRELPADWPWTGLKKPGRLFDGMGMDGLLGVAGMIMKIVIVDHSRKFPTKHQ